MFKAVEHVVGFVVFDEKHAPSHQLVEMMGEI
jgi:hypothetical protein